MLLDSFGPRRFTRGECALLEYGARALAPLVEHPGGATPTEVGPFDVLEADEKLVALHILCRRAASDEVPPRRELWLDATLVAVVTWLKEEVELALDLPRRSPGQRWARKAREELSRLVVESYLSFSWRPEEVAEVTAEERCDLDHALLAMSRDKWKASEVPEGVLQAVLEDYQASWFYDLDFLSADALDLPPHAYREHLATLGIQADYHQECAPSCPPQAVRQAREFLFPMEIAGE